MENSAYFKGFGSGIVSGWVLRFMDFGVQKTRYGV